MYINMAKNALKESVENKEGGNKCLWADPKLPKKEGKRKNRWVQTKNACGSATKELHGVEGPLRGRQKEGWNKQAARSREKPATTLERSFNVLWLLLLLCQLLATGRSPQQAALSTFLGGVPQLWRLHLHRKYQRPPGDRKSRIFGDKLTYAAQVHTVRGRCDNCAFVSCKSCSYYLLQDFPSLFFLFFSTRDLLSDLNFPFLTSSAWLIHEGAKDGLAPLRVCRGPA